MIKTIMCDGVLMTAEEALEILRKKHPELMAKVEEEKEVDVVDEDWLSGVSCNPNAPEECESCQ